MPDDDTRAMPFGPVPAIIWVLAALIAGGELLIWAGAQGWIGGADAAAWRLQAIQRHGMSRAVVEWMLTNRQFPPDHLQRLFTYPFVQIGPLQAGLVTLALLTLGRVVGDVLRSGRLLVTMAAATLGGALAFGAIPGTVTVLIGGFPVMFGLLGAFAGLLMIGGFALRIRRARAFALITLMLGLRLALGLSVEPGVTWVADLTAFAVGAGAAMLARPGGLRALRASIRHE